MIPAALGSPVFRRLRQRSQTRCSHSMERGCASFRSPANDFLEIKRRQTWCHSETRHKRGRRATLRKPCSAYTVERRNLNARSRSPLLRQTLWIFLLFLWLAPFCCAQNPTPEKIIIDTDIGDDVDDAFAVALALRSPELQILGITTTFGD